MAGAQDINSTLEKFKGIEAKLAPELSGAT